MITYVLLISNCFPKGHRMAGAITNFEAKIIKGMKIHTIRGNYPFWAKRIEKIQASKAVLSVRQWIGKPYAKGSTQKELFVFGAGDGVGVQPLKLDDIMITGLLKNNDVALTSINGGLLLSHIAKNDGLSYNDFKEWFRKYDLSKPMAIIHFTPFRY